jgi:hypothetical protein
VYVVLAGNEHWCALRCVGARTTRGPDIQPDLDGVRFASAFERIAYCLVNGDRSHTCIPS